MITGPISIDELKEKLKAVDSVRIVFTDLGGRLRNLSVNPDFFERVAHEGVAFDGSSVDGVASVGSSDTLLVPAPESLKILEFEDGKTAFFTGRIYSGHKTRSPHDPRALLESVLAKAKAEFQCTFLAGPEYEFFLLRGEEAGKNIHTDSAGYMHTPPHDRGEVVRRNIVRTLKACGVRCEKEHHEVTPSQHEIVVECSDPLEAADRTLLFHYVAGEAAARQDCRASFMPKPFDGMNRNAFHIHLSMKDLNGGNLFYAAEDEHRLSPVARHFIGGILQYARQTSIIMASTFNSYKAYIADREAPIVRGWGVKNRSSMVRIPYAADPRNTRIELRTPDPAGNVYLQLAVLVAMGLRGIENDLDCGAPDVGSTYQKHRKTRLWDTRYIPKSMFEALVEAERSAFLKETLGKAIYDNYMALKTADWEEHRTHVTEREHAKYLGV